MIPVTLSPSASSEPIQTFRKWVGSAETGAGLIETGSLQPPSIVYRVEQPGAAEIVAERTAIGALVDEWSRDDQRRAALEEARRWLSGTLQENDGDTIRTLRLRKGWSQQQLATHLNTSQSHVARIERGTENLTIDTCRRLARVLEIDMNTLDDLLQRQEKLAAARTK